MLISKKVRIKTNPSNLNRLKQYYPNINNNQLIEISRNIRKKIYRFLYKK